MKTRRAVAALLLSLALLPAGVAGCTAAQAAPGLERNYCPAGQQMICTGGTASRIKNRPPAPGEQCSCGQMRHID